MSLALLTKDALLAAARARLPIERLDIPELGGFVYVRGMSGTERDAWEKSLVIRRRGQVRDINTENVRAKLAAKCLCTESGERLLSEEDAGVLGGLRVDVLNRIYEAAQRLSGVSDGDLEELGKPSAPAAGSDSSSN